MSACSHHLSVLSVTPIGGIARAIIWTATAGVLGLLSALPINAPLLLTPANAQQANEQRALITVRDVSGLKGAPVPLGLQVHAPSPEGTLITVHVGDLPKGASLSDGSRTAIAAKERDLIDVTGWNLANTIFTLPLDITGEFTLTAVVTVENGARPLLTQAAFLVNIGEDRSLPVGPVRTVQAEVGPSQITVRTTVERNSAEQAQAGPRVPAPGQTLQETKSAMDRLRGTMVETVGAGLGPATSTGTSMPKKPARAQPGRHSGPHQQATAQPVRPKTMKAARLESRAEVGRKSPARKAEAEPVRGQSRAARPRADRPHYRPQARHQPEQRRKQARQAQWAQEKRSTALRRHEVAPTSTHQLPQGLRPIFASP